jgi:hypothetical protein
MAGSAPSCQPRASVAGNAFPSIGRIARNISAGLALSLPLAITWAQPAQAVLIFNFYESGSDLVIEGTGSLSLPSPLATFPLPFSTGLLDLDSAFAIGIPDPRTGIGLYSITGPTTLGVGIIPTSKGGIPSSSDSDISLALIYSINIFAIDSTYASGTSILSSSTFTGISLASLGMPNSGTLGTWMIIDPGDPTYVGDTISVQVNATSGGSPASVPGHLPVLGLAAAFGFSRKLRKRIKLHKGTIAVSTPPVA